MYFSLSLLIYYFNRTEKLMNNESSECDRFSSLDRSGVFFRLRGVFYSFTHCNELRDERKMFILTEVCANRRRMMGMWK